MASSESSGERCETADASGKDQSCEARVFESESCEARVFERGDQRNIVFTDATVASQNGAVLQSDLNSSTGRALTARMLVFHGSLSRSVKGVDLRT
jgi:hypothetical protein